MNWYFVSVAKKWFPHSPDPTRTFQFGRDRAQPGDRNYATGFAGVMGGSIELRRMQFRIEGFDPNLSAFYRAAGGQAPAWQLVNPIT